MDKPVGILPGALEQYQLKDTQAPKEQGKIGQEAFFELMVTQLQNQDPMKPMESGDFLGQIAQFSTVHGIDDLQKSFASLASSLQSSQALQASTMVGRHVALAGDTVTGGGDAPVNISASLATAATSVNVTISDSGGQIIKQAALGPQSAGRVRYSWDGLNNQGEKVPLGNYAVRFDAGINGQQEALQSEITARVDSVTLSRDGQAPTLNIDGFGAIAMSDVIEIL